MGAEQSLDGSRKRDGNISATMSDEKSEPSSEGEANPPNTLGDGSSKESTVSPILPSQSSIPTDPQYATPITSSDPTPITITELQTDPNSLPFGATVKHLPLEQRK
ncbi:hypothetical protein OSTOST_06158, partial [Ostertagia ostertagi]